MFWKHFLLHCICVISTFDSRCCYSCFGEPSFLPKLLQSTCCVRSFFLSLYHGYAVIALELFFARSIIPSPSVFVTVYSIIKWLSGETSHSVVLSNIRSLSIHCANAFLWLCFFPTISIDHTWPRVSCLGMNTWYLAFLRICAPSVTYA